MVRDNVILISIHPVVGFIVKKIVHRDSECSLAKADEDITIDRQKLLETQECYIFLHWATQRSRWVHRNGQFGISYGVHKVNL